MGGGVCSCILGRVHFVFERDCFIMPDIFFFLSSKLQLTHADTKKKTKKTKQKQKSQMATTKLAFILYVFRTP